ncbi:MAG: hypothetical protein K2L59_02095 [Muribaculaceae bacterium]|nr:hypothetical protein [Muribaculaceae bacterium]
MKKTIALILSALTLIPAGSMAQTLTFSTNSSPGVTVSTNPFGTGIGVTTPFFNTVYTSDGYYDAYGHFHKHRHTRHHKVSKARRKAIKKARKAYRKEMKKQYKKAMKHRRHHHDD